MASHRHPGKLLTVLVHQAKIFAGATMEFHGEYGHHQVHGEQFKAVKAIEKKPADSAALEKYLGSGLIRGVGPATAKKIVQHFRERTLKVFEESIGELMAVPGIAEKKLEAIKVSWEEHRSIRDVMLFLQKYDISTLFAVKIFKAYGDKAIATVSKNPYQLAKDIYGIGFFSADKIALSMGYDRRGEMRIQAGILHTLQAGRDQGHCYLLAEQILKSTEELLQENELAELVAALLADLESRNEIKRRDLPIEGKCYYSKSLYYDELFTAKKALELARQPIAIDMDRVRQWLQRYCSKEKIQLSDEQRESVEKIVNQGFAILTGGPGCGKTTTTRVLTKLLSAMNKKILLAAPTGRAAQRMTEVIGLEAKTLHRLLEWNPANGGFKKTEEDPLEAEFLIVDECSMLDINLSASLLRAVPPKCQVLFIGDPDQLPAVGAGNVLLDLIKSNVLPLFRLTKIFRQAEQSSIIRFAHQINAGEIPRVISPLAQPDAFKKGHDCLFVDTEEVTREQVKFLNRARQAMDSIYGTQEQVHLARDNQLYATLKYDDGAIIQEKVKAPPAADENYGPTAAQKVLQPFVLKIPEKLRHVDFGRLSRAQTEVEEIRELFKKIHPWSSLHHGFTAVETLLRLYTKTLPNWLGPKVEIQILTPQVRGSLGTMNLNSEIQKTINPQRAGVGEVKFGEKIFRCGDRVIQTRNNYDLAVFNGDIGRITNVDTEDMSAAVQFQGLDAKEVIYEKQDLADLNHAYAITIHKSQGSEFEAVIIPVFSQHFNMLFRNLIYTGLTRAKKLAVFVGSRQAFSYSIQQVDSRHRQTALETLLRESCG